MIDQTKLSRWAEKLLDTGKRNNLINFKDTKLRSAELVYPDLDTVFSSCSVGRRFDVFDPGLTDEDETENVAPDAVSNIIRTKTISKTDFIQLYEPKIKNNKTILLYSNGYDSYAAVQNIAKKEKEIQEETGLNVAYLAFGFIRWCEKDNKQIYFRAPLLLVHVNVLQKPISMTGKNSYCIEVTDDDVILNPTFHYLLQAEYHITLPEYEDGQSLREYLNSISEMIQVLKWEVEDACKLGIFSFLKINMYEDLMQNMDRILESENIRAILGSRELLPQRNNIPEDNYTINNPLIELHSVVDADSSQIEAIEMAKSGRSFVLQGPPGTGKSQTITNIIAECLFDGKKVLFECCGDQSKRQCSDRLLHPLYGYRSVEIQS